MSYVLIIAAKSDIAQAVALKYADEGYNLYLSARNINQLNDFANHIKIRFEVKVECVELDILDYPSHQGFYDSLDEKPYGIISVVGYLGEQKIAQSNFNESEKIIATNYIGVVSLLNVIANDFEKRKSGFIIGISSVAGDRGRKSNYMYGSAKAGLSAYLSGLRNRLHEAGVHVLTVKPGFVATQMTQNMDLPEKLTAQPELVAQDIFNAQQKGKNVLYTKWLWRWIMLIIKLIPEWKFKNMSL